MRWISAKVHSIQFLWRYETRLQSIAWWLRALRTFPACLSHQDDETYDSSWGLQLPEGGRSGTGGGRGREGGGLQELRGHEKTVTCLSVTADSSVLVSGSEDGTARSWHVASRQCVQKIEGIGKGASAM